METASLSETSNLNTGRISVGVGFADAFNTLALGNRNIAQKTDFESVQTGRTNKEEKIEVDIGDTTKTNTTSENNEEKLTLGSTKKKKEAQLETAIQDDIYLSQFEGNLFYLICQQTLQGEMGEFNKLDKGRQAAFLVKLYRTPDASSDEVLKALLPYVETATLDFSFRFENIDRLGSTKKMAFLKRLAPENSKTADQLTILILLSSDPDLIANCPLNTLLNLRKKEYLGEQYYNTLLQNNNGENLSKEQFQQLAQLSAKISTICFAYFLEAAGHRYDRSIRENLAFTRKDLNTIKGLTRDEKDYLYKGFLETGLVSKAQQPSQASNKEQVKKDINNILASALEMAAQYMATVKLTESVANARAH